MSSSTDCSSQFILKLLGQRWKYRSWQTIVREAQFPFPRLGLTVQGKLCCNWRWNRMSTRQCMKVKAKWEDTRRFQEPYDPRLGISIFSSFGSDRYYQRKGCRNKCAQNCLSCVVKCSHTLRKMAWMLEEFHHHKSSRERPPVLHRDGYEYVVLKHEHEQ